jgi:hypothetical protein
MRRYLDPHWWLTQMSARRCKDSYSCGNGPHSHHLTALGRVRYLGWRRLWSV